MRPTSAEFIGAKTPPISIFVFNQKEQPVEVTASFRVAGRVPELWHADTGLMEPAPHRQKSDGCTAVLLNPDPVGSVFVVFRQPADGAGFGLQKPPAPEIATLKVEGSWELRFPSGWDAPEKISLEKLASWTDDENAAVKYFSGTATYEKEFGLSDVAITGPSGGRLPERLLTDVNTQLRLPPTAGLKQTPKRQWLLVEVGVARPTVVPTHRNHGPGFGW